MSWIADAACNSPDVDPGWFDNSGKGSRPVEAMRVCEGCPVRHPCLEYALNSITSDDQGIWGGTTPKARNEIRNRRMSRERAMRQGNYLAGQPSDREARLRREPWLADLEEPRQPRPKRCDDCPRAAMAGGRWCLTCFQATANPTRSGCGTDAGYARHRRAGEEPCRACREAHSNYNQSRRAS